MKDFHVFISIRKLTFLYEFTSSFEYLENLVTSSDRDNYQKSKFAKKCKRGVKGERVSGLSRSLIQGHLMLSIILHNAQRPATVANLRLIDFQDAETMPTGDRVAKVS